MATTVIAVISSQKNILVVEVHDAAFVLRTYIKISTFSKLGSGLEMAFHVVFFLNQN